MNEKVLKVKIAPGVWIYGDYHNYIVEMARPRNPNEKRGKVKKVKDGEEIKAPVTIQGIKCRIKTSYFPTLKTALRSTLNQLIIRNLKQEEFQNFNNKGYGLNFINLKKFYEMIKSIEAYLDPEKIQKKINQNNASLTA